MVIQTTAKHAALGYCLLACVSSLSGCMVWDGAFRSAEYRLHMTDARGAAVPNVELTVRDAAEKVSYGFPVSDFSRSVTLRSDATGTLVFHHVSDGLEFGGKCFAPFCHPRSPQFFLDLSRAGHTVACVDFADFATAKPSGRITATMLLPLWTASIALEHAGDPSALAVRDRAEDAARLHDELALLTVMPVAAALPLVERDVILR